MTSLALRVSMGGGDRLPSGDPSAPRTIAPLSSYLIKKELYEDNVMLGLDYIKL